MRLGASSRSPARPRHRPRAPQPGPPIPPAPSTPNFARNSPTTASSFELRSLELQRFWALLKLHPIELRASFLEGKPRHCPQVPLPLHNTCRPPCLKPMTPMRVGHCLEMKPPILLRAPFRTRLKPLTPLLARNGHFRAIFCPQRRPRFHPHRTLRPQPKPCVACAHATTPVAHWPHD